MTIQPFRSHIVQLWAIYILILTFGCVKSTNLTINTAGSRKITVEFPTDIMGKENILKNAALMSKHLDSCSLIQLETRPECLIGEINKVFIYKERLYIHDRKVTKSVFIFDLNGKWISTIARSGHGPGEYINITDMFIDPLYETLNLVAKANKKIMTFSLDGKELLSETTHSYPIMSMVASREGSYVGHTGTASLSKDANSTMICFKDHSLSKLSYRAFPTPEGWRTILGMESPLTYSEDDVYYIQAIQNKIYKMDSDSIYLAYEFDFPSRNPEPNLTEEQFENLSPTIKANTIFRITRFSPFSGGIIAEVLFSGSIKLIFISNDFQTVEVFRTIVNPLIEEYRFGLVIGMSEQNIITQIAPRSVASDLENKSFPQFAPFIKKYIRNPIQEDDNPILCVYHLK